MALKKIKIIAQPILDSQTALTAKQESLSQLEEGRWSTSREQTAPSPLPVIKPAVGGRVWERSREDVNRAGSGLPPSGVTGTMQDDDIQRALFSALFSGKL